MAKSLHIQAKNSDMKAFQKGILNKIILAVKKLFVNFRCAYYSSKAKNSQSFLVIGQILNYVSSYTRDYSTPS